LSDTLPDATTAYGVADPLNAVADIGKTASVRPSISVVTLYEFDTLGVERALM